TRELYRRAACVPISRTEHSHGTLMSHIGAGLTRRPATNDDDRPQDHLHHEGVRTGWCQPTHHLQLDRQRQGRVRPNGRRAGADLPRHALARTPAAPADEQRSLLMRATDPTRARTPVAEPSDLGLLFHRLNNQLGIILANAELLEAKAADEMTRARASQVV